MYASCVVDRDPTQDIKLQVQHACCAINVLPPVERYFRISLVASPHVVYRDHCCTTADQVTPVTSELCKDELSRWPGCRLAISTTVKSSIGGLALRVPDCILIVRKSGLPLYETMARRRIIARRNRRVAAARIGQLIDVSLRVCRYKQHP